MTMIPIESKSNMFRKASFKETRIGRETLLDHNIRRKLSAEELNESHSRMWILPSKTSGVLSQ